MATTLNPADCNSKLILSNGNLTMKGAPSTSADMAARSTTSKTTGKWQYNVTINSFAGAERGALGFANSTFNVTNFTPPGSDSTSVADVWNGKIVRDDATSIDLSLPSGVWSFSNWAANDVINLIVDVDNKKFFVGRNGTFYPNGSGSTQDPATPSTGLAYTHTGAIFACLSVTNDSQLTLNFSPTTLYGGAKAWDASTYSLNPTVVAYAVSAPVVRLASARKIVATQQSYALGLESVTFSSVVSHPFPVTVVNYAITTFTTKLAVGRKLNESFKHYHVSDGWFNWNPGFNSNTDYTLGGGATITADIYVGQTITATAATWTGSPTAINWAWFQDGVTAIPGTNSLTYTAQQSDVGHYLAIQESATNASGTTAQMSNLIGPVKAVQGTTQVVTIPNLIVQSYPSASNPPTIPITLDAYTIVGDTIKLQWSQDSTFATFSQGTHTLTQTDATNGSASGFGIPTLATNAPWYFRSRIENATGTGAWANIVSWNDAIAPVITISPNTYNISELVQLAIPITANKPYCTFSLTANSTTGLDRNQFDIANNVLTWANNGVADFSKPNDFGRDNTYQPMLLATDTAGNQSTFVLTINVAAIDKNPDQFTLGNVSGAALNTPCQSNNVQITGITPGFNIPVSITNGAAWQKNSAGGFSTAPLTVQNNDFVQLQLNSSTLYSTTVSSSMTIGTTTAAFNITTMPDPNRASYTPSTNQPAAINKAFSSSSCTFTAIDFQVGFPVIYVLDPQNGRTIVSVVVKGAGAGGTDISLIQDITGTIKDGVWTGSTISTAGNYDVVVTHSATNDWFGIMPGTISNSSSQHPTATCQNAFASASSWTATSAMTIGSTGVGIAFLRYSGSGTVSAANPATLIVNNGLNGVFNFTGNHGFISRVITSATWTPTFTTNSGNFGHILGGVWS